MITVSDAFWKFRGRLETTDTEDATASGGRRSCAASWMRHSASSQTS